MTDNKVNNNSKWQNLDWEKKVAICNQGIANEDSLLHSYIIIFIALEAVLFAAVFSKAWGILWAVLLVSLLGLFLAILWVHVTELRGNAVDRWAEILAGLWAKMDASKVGNLEKGVLELEAHYRGSLERREKRRKGRRKAVILGWGYFGRFRSARWVLTVFIPLLVVTGWILVIVVTILGAFD